MLSEFRKYLNPVQVIDLADRKPTAALQWCILLPNKQLRILVGGGDGTVAWVLTTSHKLDLDVCDCYFFFVKVLLCTFLLARTCCCNNASGYRQRFESCA